jgi:regulatory protein
MEEHVTANEAILFCIDSVNRRACTEAQLMTKLANKGYPEHVIASTLTRARDLLLLNDRLYAQTLAAAHRDNGRGRRRVAQKLREDGVDKELVEEVLAETFDIRDDENERALHTLTQRFPQALSRVEQRQALSFLLRRGFENGAARTAISTHSLAEDDKGAGPDVNGAVALLKDKYPSLNPRASNDIKRAQGFLTRRGCSFDIIRQALDTLRA